MPRLPFILPENTRLYAAAYRPILRAQRPEIDLWPASFGVGERLPALPLYLRPDLGLLVDLEASCADACQRRGLR